MPPPDDLRQRLEAHGQAHVLAWWDRLSPEEQDELRRELQALDLDELERLYATRHEAHQPPDPERIAPIPVVPRQSPDNAEAKKLGEEALRRGEVAALIVAGGQGTRLDFDRAKGLYPIGPVSARSLFEIHVEKVRAIGRRYGVTPPLLIMTSHATHEETVAYFEARDHLGLPEEGVFFFEQGRMPALDFDTGKLLLESPARLSLSPDGHGGVLTALSESGLLEQMRGRGVRDLFYFQVDNPLVEVADPTYLGQHLKNRAEVSCKVIAKRGPKERMGNFALVDGECRMIEYSDLPDDLAHQTDANGRLRLWAGNPAIHCFDLDFLHRLNEEGRALPFHVARKKVPHINERGQPVSPKEPNALKFERFIFDVLPLAERWLLVESERKDEFAPVKSAKGEDTPAETRAAMTALAAEWLERAGGRVPRGPDGEPRFALEVSPLFALDAGELASKIPKGTSIEGPRYFR